ncbi:MAG TPA: AMP-binding protein, partial [Nevskiaceae bacterium]|nr:AMP-binding protein [Nevskiaceae bacterium]
MTLRSTPRTASAYNYQLTIKQLLRTTLVQNADQEIVYRGTQRFTYRQWFERVGRLASALTTVGAEPGTTVAVMDWDSHRYLECFFAIPMMGCVMQTVN